MSANMNYMIFILQWLLYIVMDRREESCLGYLLVELQYSVSALNLGYFKKTLQKC